MIASKSDALAEVGRLSQENERLRQYLADARAEIETWKAKEATARSLLHTMDKSHAIITASRDEAREEIDKLRRIIGEQGADADDEITKLRVKVINRDDIIASFKTQAEIDRAEIDRLKGGIERKAKDIEIAWLRGSLIDTLKTKSREDLVALVDEALTRRRPHED